MPLLAGDIRFARSINMADVPEGGGPPSSQLLTSGMSNEIFPDISEETRTVGRVEIYQIFNILQNADRAPLLGANAIIAQPPADPGVSVTLLSLKDPFATRADIAKRIEAGMAAGSEWSGFLLEDHFTTMRAVQLFQRPGMPPPVIGKTYVLVYQEGTPSERRQRIRIKAVTTEERIFTSTVNGQLIDFPAQVSTCELFDGLAYDFPGSPPSRYFARDTLKTMVRETIYTDAGLFYSASPLAAATQITDTWIKAESIYTQVVPNSKTEAASVDQRPAARHTLTLATSPRQVDVGTTAHTQRVPISEVNVGLTYVFQCTPLPAPGTLFIDYWALGQRYTITDDPAEGKLTGSGGGAVNYLTGAVSVTLKAVPDIGSMITLSHGSAVSYVNRAGSGATIRPPEYCWMIGAQETDASVGKSIVPGTLVIGYVSGGVAKTVTDDGAGKLTGDGTGTVDYPSRSVLLRPSSMPDPAGEFAVACDFDTLVTETFNLASLTPDAGGFVSLSFAQQPAAGTLEVSWAVARAVSNTSGGQIDTTTSTKKADVTYIIKSVPEFYEPAPVTGGGVNWPRADY
ncbi:MAG: hypothetical protein WA917_13600 [Comamonas sp.]